VLSITKIASGSSGNCYRIQNEQDVLMIECGIRFKLIQEAFDYQLSNVCGCLITHEHGDHCKALNGIIKTGIDCYMSEGTIKAIGEKSHRIKTISSGKQFRVGSFKILPFNTQHDASEPVGFLIQSGNDKLLYASDTYYIKHKFKGLRYIMVECNYSKAILDENTEKGIIPVFLRNRVLKSHFELENVKKFLMANDLSQVQEIHLIHISGTNGDPEFFKNEIEKTTGVPVYI